MQDSQKNKNQGFEFWDIVIQCAKHWRAYAIACSVAVVVAIVIGISSPNRYAAEITIVDENTEMDISVGKDPMSAWLPKDPSIDKGINDPEIYSQIIEAPEFDKVIAKTHIPTYGNIDYYHYLLKNHKEAWWNKALHFIEKLLGDENEEEYIYGVINDNIKYKVSAKYQTVMLQVTDNDPEVAVVIVEAVHKYLHEQVVSYKQRFTDKLTLNALNQRAETGRRYHEAFDQYASYADANQDAILAGQQTELDNLRKEVSDAFSRYNYACQQYYHFLARAQSVQQPFTILKDVTTPVKPYSPNTIIWVLALLTIAFIITTWWVLSRTYKFTHNLNSLLDPFSPWVITLAVWIAIIVMFQFQKDLLYPLSDQFYICVTLWLIIFIVCSVATYYLMPSSGNTAETKAKDLDISMLAFNTMYVISMIITPLYLYEILQVVAMFDPADMLNNIRLLAVFGDESHGFLSYSYIMNQVLLVSGLWQYPKIPKWKLATIFAATFMSAFAIMEKGMLFFIILVTLFVMYQKKRIKLRTIGLSGAAVILLFFIINVLRSGSLASLENNDSTLLNFFAIYILSPSVAFGRVAQDITTQVGSHTFQVPYLLLNQWGFGNFEINIKTQDFVYVPLPTNVYTIFQPFFQDFSYRGVAFFAMLYGTVTGFLYRMYKNGNGICRCIYTYFVYVLVLQFFQENIFMNIVMIMQFVLFTMLIQQQTLRLNLKFKPA